LSPAPAGAEPILADESSGQQRRFAHAFDLIRQAIANRVFPGAVLAVAHRGRLLAWHAFGRFTYDPVSPEVRRETLWDLASLTKPIATVSMAMLLFERGQLPLDAPVANFLPHFADAWAGGDAASDAAGAPYLPQLADVGRGANGGASNATQRTWRHSVTVAMLLAHTSGLPAHRKLYLETSGREAIQTAVRHTPLEAKPGTRVLYSDLGFILLGELLEQIAPAPAAGSAALPAQAPAAGSAALPAQAPAAGSAALPAQAPAAGSAALPVTAESLDRFCQREIFAPLNLNMSFTAHPSIQSAIPPTANDLAYRHRIIQGEVNDENASAMGGVAPHAGLFSDALSVARFAQCLLNGGPPLFRHATVELFTTRQQSPAATSRTLGWDTPSPPSQSGTLFSTRSFGHLGYTGTSLWCDPERRLSVTLLTNRTWPDSSNQAIQQLRPPLHDAIVRALDED
jgi:CubicO group peptidase (beta-lactamase class C family)